MIYHIIQIKHITYIRAYVPHSVVLPGPCVEMREAGRSLRVTYWMMRERTGECSKVYRSKKSSVGSSRMLNKKIDTKTLRSVDGREMD